MSEARFVEAHRERLRAAIPGWYSGRAHWWILNLASLTGIALCLAALDAPAWWEWSGIPGFLALANGFEWWIHRGPMHRPFRGLRVLHRHHALEHHVFFPGDRMAVEGPRDRFFVLFSPLFAPLLVLVGLPVAYGLGAAGLGNTAWLLLACAIAYYLLYEWLHTLHHLPEDSAWVRAPAARRLRAHHTTHHDPVSMERGNFNVSFPLWDYLLGTRLPAREPRVASADPAMNENEAY